MRALRASPKELTLLGVWRLFVLMIGTVNYC